jgi:hypothetical protein
MSGFATGIELGANSVAFSIEDNNYADIATPLSDLAPAGTNFRGFDSGRIGPGGATDVTHVRNSFGIDLRLLDTGCARQYITRPNTVGFKEMGISVDGGGNLTTLARISQRGRCIGLLNLRKSCCSNGLSRSQGKPDADRV